MANKLARIPWRYLGIRALETEAALLRYTPQAKLNRRKNRIPLNILTCKFTIFTALGESKNRDELVAKIKQKKNETKKIFIMEATVSNCKVELFLLFSL